MWHFTTLDEAQKARRRELLDLYATIAQGIVLVPLLLLQLYFLGCWVVVRSSSRGWGRDKERKLEMPGSPYLKKERSGRLGGWVMRVRVMWRRLAWRFKDRVVVLGVEATWGEIVVTTGWTAVLLVLCMVQTENDYLHLTKRFGIVGASQLPLHYLLAFKTPYSPLQLLTRCSWETLNNLHQQLGRIITFLFYLHVTFYLNFFVQAHVLAKRIKDKDVILGLIAIAAFSVVGTTALSFIRKRNYRLFYSIHVILATLLLPVLYFHVHHLRIYIWETLALYAVHLATRYSSEKPVSASITFVPGTPDDLLDITIPLATNRILDTVGSGLKRTWPPGQHVYLSLATKQKGLFSLLSGRPIKSRNPFTIASLPREDRVLRLVARVMDGNTAALAAEARSGKGRDVQLTIEGPYGLATHSLELLNYSRVLFVAGGVGATFIVPLYRSLLRDLSPSPGSSRRKNVRFVWAVRDESEVGWAIPDDEAEAKGVRERMSVFVTRGHSAARTEGGDDDGYMGARPETDRVDDEEEGVELEQLLPGEEAETTGHTQDGKQLDVNIGRPDFRALVNETFAGVGEHERVAIFVCGPKSMAKAVRHEAGRWNEKRQVWLWSEEFGL